jgi:hypothetical protein
MTLQLQKTILNQIRHVSIADRDLQSGEVR